MNHMPKVYIILLNWNNWQDTIECLESVLKLDYDNYTVLVCDNASTDGSMEKMKQWALGHQMAHCSEDKMLRELVVPYVEKPLKYAFYRAPELQESAGPFPLQQLVFIESERNLGFAGGNNIGLRYALRQGDMEYVWLLNNDTVVPTSALRELLETAEASPYSICGSKLVYYNQPQRVQALGNSFNTYLGTTSFVVEAAHLDQSDFGIGASLLLPAAVFAGGQLLNESYFLYYEEADLWQRTKQKYRFVCSLQSMVYHKEGASIGANNKVLQAKSLIGDFYGIRNRLLFMKRYYPRRMPFVYLGLLVTIFHRIFRKQYGRIGMIAAIIRNPLLTFEEYMGSKRS